MQVRALFVSESQGSRPHNNGVNNPPPEITEKYTIKKELGKGAYGTVYLAVDNDTEKEYFSSQLK